MSAVAVLVLRILLAGSLFAFLFVSIFRMWEKTFERRITTTDFQSAKAVLTEIESEKSVLLDKSEVYIGRDKGNEISIPDEVISARHAKLFFSGGNWLIQDLGSTNGTYLNEQQIFVPTALLDGDIVSIGNNNYQFGLETQGS